MSILLFAGCVRADIGIDVKDDGSGTASVLFAFDKSLIDLLGSFDEGGESTSPEDFDPESVFEDVDRSQLPKDTKVEPYEQDGFVGARMTAPFARVEDLPGLLNLMTANVAIPGDTSTGDSSDGSDDDDAFESFDLVKTDNGWKFDAVVAPAGGGELAEAGEDDFTADFLKDASFTVRMKLPGKIGANNADHVEGNTLIWDLDITATENRTLTAESSGSGSGSSSSGAPWLIIGGVIVAVVVVGAGAWLLMQRRKPAAPQTSPPVPPASVDPPPPPSVE